MDGLAADVLAGLSMSPKTLSSRYFYDEKGDELFTRIMELPEYYLTRCEQEIFDTQADEIIQSFGFGKEPFEIIELGAGDGSKTITLLEHLRGLEVCYIPIDISQNVLNILENRLNTDLPWLDVRPRQGEYFQVLDELRGPEHKVILFLGSNIGNLMDSRAQTFLSHLSDEINSGDRLMIGFDLKKSKDIVLPAYNDSAGVTKAFNLNLLERINRELGADFDLSKFDHAPEYDEKSGVARSYLKSLEHQTVRIQRLDKTFKFYENEQIFVEISRKYDEEIIDFLIKDLPLTVHKYFYDPKKYFCDVVFVKE